LPCEPDERSSERERFLRELDRHLRLRGARRADALAEIQSHIDEAVAAGEDERQAIERLGTSAAVAAGLNRSGPLRPLLVSAALAFGALAALLAGWALWFGGGGAARREARVPPARPEAVRSWRLVVEDWIMDGRFDRRHPCAAVREARRRLPEDIASYSCVHEDFRRYARTVC
jgi:hypothetical protein